jgi:hypothetical protein
MFANNFARNYEKNNTLNFRRLVDETIVPLKIVGFMNVRYSDFMNELGIPYKLCNRWEDYWLFHILATCQSLPN